MQGRGFVVVRSSIEEVEKLSGVIRRVVHVCVGVRIAIYEPTRVELFFFVDRRYDSFNKLRFRFLVFSLTFSPAETSPDFFFSREANGI